MNNQHLTFPEIHLSSKFDELDVLFQGEPWRHFEQYNTSALRKVIDKLPEDKRIRWQKKLDKFITTAVDRDFERAAQRRTK